MIGSPTKEGEYYRTVEMLQNITGSTEEQIMYALYFLYDSSYEGCDLKIMADLMYERKRLRTQFLQGV